MRTTSDITLYLILTFIIIVMVGIIYLVLSMLFHETITKKRGARIRQAKKQQVKRDFISKTQKQKELVQSFSKPLEETILANYRPRKVDLLLRKLKVTGWDVYFNPTTWAAFHIWSSVLGILLTWLLWENSKIVAIAIGIFLAIFPTLLLNNAFKNINTELLMQFPQTIRIISGYLSAGLIMPRAFEMAAKSAKPRWQKILNTFTELCDTKGVGEALDWIKEEVDIMEAREFFAAIRLAIDDGIDPLESFEKQAKTLQQLLIDINRKKIQNRKVIAIALNIPILALIMATFMLPLIGVILDFFGKM